MLTKTGPIGIFDSGVGGLSVLRAIHSQYPAEHLVYIADQANVPYGSRSLKEVRGFAENITRFLLSQGAKLIVVACNTASAASLHYLRDTFRGIPFVGMEPAVKPAAKTTQSGVVGVLATPATFQGDLFGTVVERHARGVKVLKDTCPGLVDQIEAGHLDTEVTRSILENALRPMLVQGIDTVVLGCTHYPFVIPLIQELVGGTINVIDPAPAIARQTGHLLAAYDLHHPWSADQGVQGPVRYYTTGEISRFKAQLLQLLGYSGLVYQLNWQGDSLGTDDLGASTT